MEAQLNLWNLYTDKKSPAPKKPCIESDVTSFGGTSEVGGSHVSRAEGAAKISASGDEDDKTHPVEGKISPEGHVRLLS